MGRIGVRQNRTARSSAAPSERRTRRALLRSCDSNASRCFPVGAERLPGRDVPNLRHPDGSKGRSCCPRWLRGAVCSRPGARLGTEGDINHAESAQVMAAGLLSSARRQRPGESLEAVVGSSRVGNLLGLLRGCGRGAELLPGVLCSQPLPLPSLPRPLPFFYPFRFLSPSPSLSLPFFFPPSLPLSFPLPFPFPFSYPFCFPFHFLSPSLSPSLPSFLPFLLFFPLPFLFSFPSPSLLPSLFPSLPFPLPLPFPHSFLSLLSPLPFPHSFPFPSPFSFSFPFSSFPPSLFPLLLSSPPPSTQLSPSSGFAPAAPSTR